MPIFNICRYTRGGGVELSDLALATATEDTVLNGKTFYAGNTKEIRTGTALNQTTNVTANNLPSGITAYNNLGEFITGNGSGILKMKLGAVTVANRYTSVDGDPLSFASISCDFQIKGFAISGTYYYEGLVNSFNINGSSQSFYTYDSAEPAGNFGFYNNTAFINVFYYFEQTQIQYLLFGI